MFLRFYRLVFPAALACYAPFLLFRRWRKGQSCKSFWQRLKGDVPKIEKNKSPLIWLHAVSVGETRAVAALAKALMELPCKPRLVISSITDTGHAEAKRLISQAEAHVYLPLDTSFSIRNAFKNIQPDLVILTEGDFWLNFLSKAKSQGAHLVVANGKISKSSAKWYKRLPAFKKGLFPLFSLMCLQNRSYQTRFLDLGLPANQLKVTGNMKFEAPLPALSYSQKRNLYEKFALNPDHLTIVIGSTHDSEELLMLNACQEVWQKFPTCQIVIAPRHPERSDAVEALIIANGVGCVRYSQLAKDTKKASQSNKVLLIDQVGLLRDLYALADIAIVGGSFVEHVGGHNILEPALYGTPVLFGPHMWSQEELTEYILEAQGGSQVTQETLSSNVMALLDDREERARMGSAGKQLLQAQSGAIQRTLESIIPFLEK